MSEATLNPPSLEQINRDLATTVSEEMQKNERLLSALQEIEEIIVACIKDSGKKTLCEFCANKIHRLIRGIRGRQ